MLYSLEDRNNSVSLKLMVQKIVNEDISKNAVFRKQVATVMHEAKQLHQSQISIYKINSTFFQEIVFLSDNAPELIESIDSIENVDDIGKDRFEELLEILNQIK